ncbi:MAG: hypothetical protein B7733_25540 [Myxococcales bacterium FL481]|nr:MAG: hypothetical protein B7733_25540 [Myxococcales bacterium FL481]
MKSSMFNRSAVLCSMLSVAVLGLSADAGAAKNPTRRFGSVEAPTAGSESVPLADVPKDVLHTAEVALKVFEGRSVLLEAALDKDEVQPVWEILAKTRGGKLVEVDVTADARVIELEVEVYEGDVPYAVIDALYTMFPHFEAAPGRPKVEKSIRPSAMGLNEVWFEFAGVEFDVEVRSDGRALLAEPA